MPTLRQDLKALSASRVAQARQILQLALCEAFMYILYLPHPTSLALQFVPGASLSEASRRTASRPEHVRMAWGARELRTGNGIRFSLLGMRELCESDFASLLGCVEASRNLGHTQRTVSVTCSWAAGEVGSVAAAPRSSRML